jgi:hypothetical protein
MTVEKKIHLLLEMVDIDPNIPLNVGNWGHDSGPSKIFSDLVGSDKDFTNKYPGPSKETALLIGAGVGAGLGLPIFINEIRKNRLKNEGK